MQLLQNHQFAIPAKAGTQFVQLFWMPAYAGKAVS